MLGTSRRGRITRFLTGPGIGETTVDASEDIDVHMVTHEFTGRGRLPSLGRRHSRRRTVAGFTSGLLLPFGLTALLSGIPHSLNLTTVALLFQLGVVAVALLGGAASALMASLVASLLLNYYFIPPVHTFTIGEPNNVIALVVFAVVALTVSTVVDRATRQTGRAARATAEAEALSTLAGSVLRGHDGTPGGGSAIPTLLEQSRTTFGLDSVALLSRESGEVMARSDAAGEGAVDRHITEVPVGTDALLVLCRPPAARRRAAGADRLRRPCRGRPGARPAGGGGRRDRTDQGRRPDAHRAAGRRQPRPAYAAGRRARLGRPPCAARTSSSPRTTKPNCSPPPTSRWSS